MENFEQKLQNGVAIETVNLNRATYNEAQQFKNILMDDIVEKKFTKIIIDVSQCEHIDAAFLGAMIISKKKMEEIGGEIKIIQPSNPFDTFFLMKAFDVLNPHESLEKAMLNFTWLK
jgi:anti-anti-sigma regulatory factor